MNWLTNFVRPKIQALMRRQEIPDNLWTKCPQCEHMLFTKDLEEKLMVCHHCQYHMKLPIKERFKKMFNEGHYTLIELPKVAQDPLKFRDTKKYQDRLKEYRQKTDHEDALLVAQGMVGKHKVTIAAFDFSFMGGSMGMAVGEGLLTASDVALQSQTPLIVIPASGGARMQEGILSLMQMPRSVIAVERLKEASLAYIMILTDPTTGGVSASFAMLGDITIAEPGCIIGFAGARVIEEIIRQKLPEGFQKAEYLLDHGMIDMVVHRHHLKEKVSQLLDHIHKTYE